MSDRLNTICPMLSSPAHTPNFRTPQANRQDDDSKTQIPTHHLIIKPIESVLQTFFLIEVNQDENKKIL